MTTKTRFVLFAAALSVSASLLSAAQVDVPVKQVVLFSSGVGYFQHDGKIKDNDSTQLQFKTGQINDVLKSLVLQDLGGGKIGQITYPSQDPVEKTLKSFQIDITDNPSLSSLLGQLRGAKVTVDRGTEKTSGTILGVETRKKPADKGDPIDVPVLNLISNSGMIDAIELESVQGFSLDDPQLRNELTKALSALAQARDKDKKPVTINFDGSGEREVEIGYVVETPIWKTSYRLLLPDEQNQDKAQKPKIQGWAIVENQTDNDWNNVDLSLVSGRPISFVMDLYSPLYIQRPIETLNLYASLKPQTYADAILNEAEDKVTEALPAAAPALMASGGGLEGRLGVAQRSLMFKSVAGKSMDAASSVQSITQATTNIGDLFEYNVGSVTLARQKSAMLPIVTDNVQVERLSIYNASVMPHNPLTGARVTNTTGKSLMQGPITVLDSGTYAGDAKIDDLPAGQNRLLSYGIDLQTAVDSDKNHFETSILAGKISQGVLTVVRKQVRSRDYAMNNKSDRDKTIIVEHPFQESWKLVDTQKPEETTPSVYRFKTPLAAHKSSTLTVKEETKVSETIGIIPADLTALIEYSNHGEIAKPVRDALAKAAQLHQAVMTLDMQIAEHNNRIKQITDEQARIRDNMKTVDPKSAYYSRLLNKLNDQESQLEKLQSERDDLVTQKNSAQKAFEDYVNGLDLQ